MKRSVVILLVLLAVVVLVSPGIVGRLAERNLQTSIDWAEHEDDGIVVTRQRFDRRWFTSEGRYRIEFRHRGFRGNVPGAGLPKARGTPALIVTTRIDHGLIPVSSMSRDTGSLKPGLASAVSTLQFDPGNGALVNVPGKMLSEVGLSGETVSHVLLYAGSLDRAARRAAWDGADVTVTTDPSDRSVNVTGVIAPFSLAAAGERLEIGRLRLRADSAFDDGRLNVHAAMQVDDMVVPGFGDVDLTLDVAVDRLAPQAAREITHALQDLLAPEDREVASSTLYSRAEAALRRLLAAGIGLRVDRLDLVLPQGTATSRAHFDFPDTGNAILSWPALLLALTASADLRLSAALVERAQAAEPQARSLVALGFLKKDGDFYVLEAAYAEGLITINGAPLPIPLPGR